MKGYVRHADREAGVATAAEVAALQAEVVEQRSRAELAEAERDELAAKLKRLEALALPSYADICACTEETP